MAKQAKQPKDALKPVCVLVGQDTYLLDEARRRIVSAVLGEADPQTCLAQYDSSVELATVLDELRTVPFLASRRDVLIGPADDFVSEHREALEKYVAAPSPSSLLVLVVTTWDPKTCLAKAVARVGEVISCTPRERESLTHWIAEAAERRGKKIDRQAAQLLEEWVGRDYGLLDTEMEKLSLHAGSRQTVTVEDVEAISTATAGPGAFDLANALTAGDTRAALEAVGGMLTARGEEFRVLGAIGWHLRRVLAAAEQVRAGRPPQEVAPYMPWDQKAVFVKFIQRRSPVSLAGDLRRLLRADLAMKSGANPQAVLAELVVRLCSGSSSS